MVVVTFWFSYMVSKYEPLKEFFIVERGGVAQSKIWLVHGVFQDYSRFFHQKFLSRRHCVWLCCYGQGTIQASHDKPTVSYIRKLGSLTRWDKLGALSFASKETNQHCLTVDFDIMLSWGRVSHEITIASSAALSQGHTPASYLEQPLWLLNLFHSFKMCSLEMILYGDSPFCYYHFIDAVTCSAIVP
jgi:hypothetical protein